MRLRSAVPHQVLQLTVTQLGSRTVQEDLFVIVATDWSFPAVVTELGR
jgi:hypothetical protein